MLHAGYSPSEQCSVDMLHYLPSCCASLQEVLLGFCSSWHHESPKLDQMKVGSIGTAAYYGQSFCKDLSVSSQLISK